MVNDDGYFATRLRLALCDWSGTRADNIMEKVPIMASYLPCLCISRFDAISLLFWLSLDVGVDVARYIVAICLNKANGQDYIWMESTCPNWRRSILDVPVLFS